MSDTNIDDVIDHVETDASTLVDWKNPPSLSELKADFESAQVAHDVHVQEVDNWIKVLNGEQSINNKKGRSKLVPKLAIIVTRQYMVINSTFLMSTLSTFTLVC